MTKFRFQVRGGDPWHRCGELLRQIAISKQMMINADSINQGNVHMLISMPLQQFSISSGAVSVWKDRGQFNLTWLIDHLI